MRWYKKGFPEIIFETENTAQPVLVQIELPGNRIQFDVAFYEKDNWWKEDRSGDKVDGTVIAWTPIIQETINLTQFHCKCVFKRGRIFDICKKCGALADKRW